MYKKTEHHSKPKVLVTGFGLFGHYTVNASWEAVKAMNKEEIERNHNCELIIMEVPVTYKGVDDIVPTLWETYKPKLTIHVGVSYSAKCLTIETQAYKEGYNLLDHLSHYPVNEACPLDGPGVIKSEINVDRICREINKNMMCEKILADCSNDAGRYLCEYIYYTSLSIDNSRTLFVHVPEIEVYTPKRAARGLERILDLSIEQINKFEKNVFCHIKA